MTRAVDGLELREDKGDVTVVWVRTRLSKGKQDEAAEGKAESGSWEGEGGRLTAYLPGVQRELLWVVSAWLWQEIDSSVMYAAGTKMGRELGGASRRRTSHQSELVFRSSRNLSPSARDTCRPSAPV